MITPVVVELRRSGTWVRDPRPHGPGRSRPSADAGSWTGDAAPLTIAALTGSGRGGVAGDRDAPTRTRIASSACPGQSSCGGRLTDNTMQIFIAVLGIEPVQTLAPPSDEPRRLKAFPDQQIDGRDRVAEERPRRDIAEHEPNRPAREARARDQRERDAALATQGSYPQRWVAQPRQSGGPHGPS